MLDTIPPFIAYYISHIIHRIPGKLTNDESYQGWVRYQIPVGGRRYKGNRNSVVTGTEIE